MAQFNPITLWRRFLALPVDSRSKTIIVAFVVAAACSAFVSGTTVLLRPIQKANRAAEQQMRLEAMVSAIPGMQALLDEADGGALSTVVVNLEEGAAAKDITPETIEAALSAPENWTALSPEDDLALIGSRPNYLQIYFIRNEESLSLVILPIFGAGYNGIIEALIALHGDMNTIAGLTVLSHSETPGLGARIEETIWQQSFAGKRFADERGTIRFSVARGPSASEYEVDGITGATRTSSAMARIVRFWLGPTGYGPLIDAIMRREF